MSAAARSGWSGTLHRSDVIRMNCLFSADPTRCDADAKTGPQDTDAERLASFRLSSIHYTRERLASAEQLR